MSSAGRTRPAAALREAAIRPPRSIDSASSRLRSRRDLRALRRAAARVAARAQSRRALDARRGLDAACRRQPAAPASMRRDFREWVDLGSGAGFPGLVVGDRLRRTQPERHFTLVEVEPARRRRSCAPPSARPAPMPPSRPSGSKRMRRRWRAAPTSCRRGRLRRSPSCLRLAAPYLHEDSVMLLLKGQDFVHEHEAASKSWSFDMVSLPSATDPGGRVVAIRNLSPKADRP